MQSRESQQSKEVLKRIFSWNASVIHGFVISNELSRRKWFNGVSNSDFFWKPNNGITPLHVALSPTQCLASYSRIAWT